ncbi:MAG: MarR family winged helix-turn-helix transcriptional regulator [Candidatus Dormibacteria bacterium]
MAAAAAAAIAGRTVAGSGTADPLALANGLRPVLLHINRHLRREVHQMGISAGQVSLLGLLASCPGIGTGELATREGVAAPSVSAKVDRLVAAGLVRRTKPEGGDRRRVGLSVTADGQRVLRAVRSRRTAWLASRLRDLPSDQVRALEVALPALQALVSR